ncbi:MAG: transposase [Pseudomonadales bacterium]
MARTDSSPKPFTVNQNGFSLNCSVACQAHQRDRLERLCRYITRPALCLERLSTNGAGQVVYQLKNPYRDGTTHILFSPADFIARLAALVPRPRINLTGTPSPATTASSPRAHPCAAQSYRPRQALAGVGSSKIRPLRRRPGCAPPRIHAATASIRPPRH